MAPRTRRSRITAVTTVDHTGEASNANAKDLVAQGPRRTSTSTVNNAEHRKTIAKEPESRVCARKRTFVSNDPPTVLPETQAIPASQATQEGGYPSKRVRTSGSSHARPMPLQLPSEDENVSWRGSDGVVKGKRTAALERTSSFYPSRCDFTHPLSALDTENQYPHDLEPDDGDIEHEDDWLEPEAIVDAARKTSTRSIEAAATERPSWKESDTALIRTPRIYRASVPSVDMSITPSGRGSAVSGSHSILFESRTPTTTVAGSASSSQSEDPDRHRTPDFLEATWPSNTDLVTVASSKGTKGVKLLLNSQKPLVHAVVVDAIENMQASLLFTHAFPDGVLQFTFAKECLLTAADKPSTALIYSRLLEDKDYLAKLSQLPRARIPHIRSEVKDRCNAVTTAAILALETPEKISDAVQQQMRNYTYTYPTAGKSGPLAGVPRRTRPYRSKRIISVIQQLFFTASGGSPSFVSRFGLLFPVHQNDNGEPTREVPEPMVALVATALYATLYEWRTGKHKAMEFSTSTYLDVYKGHMETFKFIKENRPSAYHLMMADIYTQASATPVDDTEAPITHIDLSALED